MKVLWTSPALAHVREIESYLQERNAAAAARTVSRIEERVAQLALFPELGREGREAGTREIVVTETRYVVSYRLAYGRVEVLAVVHGARAWLTGQP